MAGKGKLTATPNGRLRLTTAEAVVAFRMLKISGAYCDADEAPIGATEIAYNDGDEASLIIGGTCILDTSEAVTEGEWLSSAADGKAKSQDAGEEAFGKCLFTTSGAAQTVCLIAPQKVNFDAP